jgi:hypothetical protein
VTSPSKLGLYRIIYVSGLGATWLSLCFCIRSDWIRTSDPYPPRKRAIAKLLNYNAARCGTVLPAFATCPMFPYPIRTAQEKPND